MIQIDIEVRAVSPEQRVWRLFPGAGYRFLSNFKENDIGYLDFPGVKIPPGDLDKSNSLIPLIAMSDAVRTAFFAHEVDSAIKFDIVDFESARKTKNRGRLRQALVNFYQHAKPGDIVILPETLSRKTVWIGEFSNSDIIYSQYHERSEALHVPCRKIKWIKEVRENLLSTKLSDALRHQHAFSLIERDRYLEVMSLAYDSFIYNERNVATIFNGEEFLDEDAALISCLSRISAAFCKADDDGIKKDDYELFDIIFGTTDIAYSCDQESDIHSEGFTRLIGGSIVPVVTTALLAAYMMISKAPNDVEAREMVEQLEVINSSLFADPQCAPRVNRITKQILSAGNFDKTLKMCDAARKAASRKLQPSAKAK
jgi:hypothetical protein